MQRPLIALLAGFAALACGGGDAQRSVRAGEALELAPSLPAGARCLYVVSGADGEQLGVALAALPDIDGDQRAELVAGSPAERADGPGFLGAVRTFSLARGARLHDATSSRPSGTDAFGERLCVLGDVDGDGRADIAVSAWRALGGRGAVEVHSGASGARLTRIEGLPADDAGLGAALVAAGDVDGDGRGDVAVGALAGGTSVFSGRDGVLLARFAGTPIALTGDLDQDGKHDLLVLDGPPRDAALLASRTHMTARVVSIVSGAPLLELIPPGDLAALDAHGAAGDVDRDGNTDWIAAFQERGTGESALVDGPRERLVIVLSGRTGQPLTQFRIRMTSRGRVHRVTGLGDVDGDGRSDVLVAWHTEQLTPQGFVEIHSGVDGALLYALASPNWSFGTSACALPDQNGDGRTDVAIGEHECSADARRGGRVYVIAFTTQP